MGSSQSYGVEESTLPLRIERMNVLSETPKNQYFDFVRATKVPQKLSSSKGIFCLQSFFLDDTYFIALGHYRGVSIIEMKTGRVVLEIPKHWIIYNLQILHCEGNLFLIGEDHNHLFSIHLDGTEWKYEEYGESQDCSSVRFAVIQTVHHFVVYRPYIRRGRSNQSGMSGEDEYIVSVFNFKTKGNCSKFSKIPSDNKEKNYRVIHVCEKNQYFIGIINEGFSNQMSLKRNLIDLFRVEDFTDSDLTMKKLSSSSPTSHLLIEDFCEPQCRIILNSTQTISSHYKQNGDFIICFPLHIKRSSSTFQRFCILRLDEDFKFTIRSLIGNGDERFIMEGSRYGITDGFALESCLLYENIGIGLNPVMEFSYGKAMEENHKKLDLGIDKEMMNRVFGDKSLFGGWSRGGGSEKVQWLRNQRNKKDYQYCVVSGECHIGYIYIFRNKVFRRRNEMDELDMKERSGYLNEELKDDDSEFLKESFFSISIDGLKINVFRTCILK